MSNQHVLQCTTESEFTAQAINILNHQLQSTSTTNLALCGGSTPIPIYHHLVQANIDWSKIHLWWSDERYVPLDHPDSNYFQAKQQLLDHLQIPFQNLHPVKILSDLGISANTYQSAITDRLGPQPSFDLIILGIGPDGHTASLFPNTPSGTNQIDTLVAPIFNSPKPPAERITFTFHLINQAKKILVLVKGQSRVAMVNNWLQGQASTLPFTNIQPIQGQVYWLLLE